LPPGAQALNEVKRGGGGGGGGEEEEQDSFKAKAMTGGGFILMAPCLEVLFLWHFAMTGGGFILMAPCLKQ